MDAIYWLILIIVLVVLEIITLGLTTIWFAGGALAGLYSLHAGRIPCDSVGGVLRGFPDTAVLHEALGSALF